MSDQQFEQKVTFGEEDPTVKKKPLTRTVTFGRQHSREKPDGGWVAWTVVASSFMISFLQDGFGYFSRAFSTSNTSPWIILCYGFHYFFIFRNNFGLIVPAIAKHFNAGRADVVLTSSFMTLLLLGSGLFWRIAKLILGSELSGIAVAILQHLVSWYQILNLRATGCCLVDLLQPPKGVLIFVSV